MKRTLSLILAALLLASSMTACGNGGSTETEQSTSTGVVETQSVETNAPATEAPDTNPPATELPETDAPAPVYPYDTSLITENGVAKSHIVIAEGASDKEKKAAEELAYHIKLVSGAEVSITNTAAEDSLPIIIATPDSLPELETLFPEDLAWLRTVGKVGDMERWGEDGFAIRQHDGKIYIFGANKHGALNGVYDFIEENLDLIWIRGDEAGIIYDEMPTINVVKADYREKSPFHIRFHSAGGATTGTLITRNKYNTADVPYGGIHNVVSLIKNSPLYDPNVTEYWDTDGAGNHVSASSTKQANFWSELTADVVAASVIAELDRFDDTNRPKYFNVNQEDIHNPSVYPEMTEPFEYAPGQFVEANDVAYLSTVFFTFINRVARQVAEKYPDVTINTLAYTWSIKPPLCDVEDNVSIWFCPYSEDYSQPSFSAALEEAASGNSTSLAALEAKYYEEWVGKHPNINLYTYYYTHYVVGWYERPIWRRIQDDFRYYARTGLLGFRVETTYEGSDMIYDWQSACRTGNPDDFTYKFTYDDARRMNLLTYWLYYKLAWNPDEDVDALIERFCDKVYGDASPFMQEYYALLELGWAHGAEIIPYEFNANLTITRDQQYYFDYFMDFELEDGTYYLDAVTNALTKAWEAADDKAKEFIRHPYEVFSGDWTRFLG